ncbi:class I SAM-dependent methyltransferase [Motilibacter deserti]|uniref:class I SAM-dependent methyltransferase n=1 Tax=Motilibacter deserti TaxID=2714956 RepID=UPI002F2B2E40
MSRLAWDHNEYYHRLLLRQLPARPQRVLDVGCGAGLLAGKLAARADRVDAVDRDAGMVAAAARAVPANVSCRCADFLLDDVPIGAYDAVVSVSALHHMPLEPALSRMAEALRPGGVLAAVALPRVDLPRELPVELAAAVAQRGLAVTFGIGRAVHGGGCHAHEPDSDAMPMVDPVLTTDEVRRQAQAVLPGAQVRRLLFWRYLLRWRKPLGDGQASSTTATESAGTSSTSPS